MANVLRLSGVGKVSSAPDIAVVTFNIITEGDASGEASSKNDAQMKQVLSILPKFGIEPRDRRTLGYRVEPQWVKEKNDKQHIAGYIATNQVSVKVRDLDIVPDVVSSLADIGVSNLNFGQGIDDATKQRLEDEARKLALSDAQRKADIYAAEGNIRLDGIDELTEYQQWGGGIGGYSGASGAAPAAARIAAPIEKGEQEVTITVNVCYNISSRKNGKKKKK